MAASAGFITNWPPPMDISTRSGLYISPTSFMSPNTPVSPMGQSLKPLSNSMTKPPGSPPTCSSSLLVAGFFHTYSGLCSACTSVTSTLGPSGVTLPLRLMRLAGLPGSTPWIDRDCASPVGAQTGALFKDRDAPGFQTYWDRDAQWTVEAVRKIGKVE